MDSVSTIARRYVPCAQRWVVAPVSTGGTTEEPVSVADLKTWMRLGSTSTGEDDLVAGVGRAARWRLENESGRAFMRRQFDEVLDQTPNSPVVELHRSPLVSVDSITSYDRTGSATVMSSSQYYVDTKSEPGRVALYGGYSWPSSIRDAAGIVIRFTAGHSTAASGIPDPIVTACKELAAFLYERRGDEPADLPPQVLDLMAEFMVPEAA
jgi:uncharacterized phiE125 gp8 family phage protein